MEEDLEDLRGLCSLTEAHLSWESTRGFFPSQGHEENRDRKEEHTSPQYQIDISKQDNHLD